MVEKDLGIFLRKVKYGDNGLIVSLLTKDEGIRPFMVQGIKSKKKVFASTLHPLAILEIEYTIPKKGGMARISEAAFSPALFDLRQDIGKNSIAYFLAEVISRSFPEEEPNSGLFTYLQTSIQFLEGHSNIGNFHLSFLIRLSRFLGFFPNGAFRKSEFFDLREGLFTTLRPTHLQYLEPFHAKLLYELIAGGLDDPIRINRNDKRILLDALIEYFHVHLENFGNLKTLRVLREMLG